MAITVNKPIGITKEIFLALCLIGGEISKTTVAMLKADFGDSRIRIGTIRYFINNGCIKKIGEKGNYGYILTPKGRQYLSIKFPDKYDYDEYTSSVSYYKDENVRARNRRLTEILYVLYRNGVDITDHYCDMEKIVNGFKITVDEPFFVTAKTLRKTNNYFDKCFGSRAYGCIVTSTSLFVVYSPDREHNLFLNRECKLYESLSGLLSSAEKPYCDVSALKALYLYPTEDDVVDSFTITPEKIGKNVAQTQRVYRRLNYSASCINTFSGNSYDLRCILEPTLEQEINRVFVEYFELTERRITTDTSFADSLYDGRILTTVNWKLNPSKITEAISYTVQRRERILMLCFEEQKELLKAIAETSYAAKNNIVIASLPSRDVIDYIYGRIDYIE